MSNLVLLKRNSLITVLLRQFGENVLVTFWQDLEKLIYLDQTLLLEIVVIGKCLKCANAFLFDCKNKFYKIFLNVSSTTTR